MVHAVFLRHKSAPPYEGRKYEKDFSYAAVFDHIVSPVKQNKKEKSELVSKLGSAMCGGDSGARTHDLLNAIQALSQLSYIPVFYLTRLFYHDRAFPSRVILLTISDVNMSTQPMVMRPVNTSPARVTAKNVPKTVSVDMRMAM